MNNNLETKIQELFDCIKTESARQEAREKDITFAIVYAKPNKTENNDYAATMSITGDTFLALQMITDLINRITPNEEHEYHNSQLN